MLAILTLPMHLLTLSGFSAPSIISRRKGRGLVLSQKGFTLIELLIVMAILGLLVVLGASSFATARIKARDAKRKADLETIAKSLEAYANDYNRYPADTGGKITCQVGVVCDWGSAFTDGQSLYTAALPADSNASNYYYYQSSSGADYSLYAHLENENDPALDTSITQSCGVELCNYKITSSNLAP